MAWHWEKVILMITLILAITIPISRGHRRRGSRSRRHGEWDSDSDDTEQYFRDLCSDTHQSDVCWNILKPELHRFDDSDDRDITNGVIDLTKEKTNQIRDQLDQWFSDSNDDGLKDKYHSCSKSYNDLDRELEKAQRNLDSDDYRKISDQIDDAEEDLNKCKAEFGGNSFDPGHVGDRNNELELYLNIVRVSVDSLRD